MIEYYNKLMQDEQEELSSIIQLLYRQTFILEHKYDKRVGRMQYNREFRNCNKYLEFIQEYFAIMGIEVREDSHDGIIYLQMDNLVGDKVSKLSTLYLLILKLIYDEQMSTVSSSSQVFTTLGDINEKMGSFGVMEKQPTPTEIRRSIAFLKKYQIIEPIDALDELEGKSRILIYPSIHMVLLGNDVRALLDTFKEVKEENGENGAEV